MTTKLLDITGEDRPIPLLSYDSQHFPEGYWDTVPPADLPAIVADLLTHMPGVDDLDTWEDYTILMAIQSIWSHLRRDQSPSPLADVLWESAGSMGWDTFSCMDSHLDSFVCNSDEL
jgi:hypothetical protein